VLEDIEVEPKKKSIVNTHNVIPTQKYNGPTGSSTTHVCFYCKGKGHLVVDCFKFKGTKIKEKYEFLKKNGICYCCLLGKHLLKDCTKKRVCGTNGCSREHHKLLHFNTASSEASSSTEATVHSINSNLHSTLFQLIPVTIYSRGRQVDTWAFLDCGSSESFISRVLANDLGMSGVRNGLTMTWTDGSTQTDPDSEIVSFRISGLNNLKSFWIKGVRTIRPQCLPKPVANLNEICKRFNHLSDLSFPDAKPKCAGILIGISHMKLMMSLESREGSWNQPVAIRTRLGWSVCGKLSDIERNNDSFVGHICRCEVVDEINDNLLKNFFTTESFGLHQRNLYRFLKRR
jgi:hypothetical protein